MKKRKKKKRERRRRFSRRRRKKKTRKEGSEIRRRKRKRLLILRKKRNKIIRTNLRITAKMTPIIIIGIRATKNEAAPALTKVMVEAVTLMIG